MAKATAAKKKIKGTLSSEVTEVAGGKGPGSTAAGGTAPASPKDLSVRGLKHNNLRNLSFTIPHDKVTVLCGLSGSGKSSVAFDTLFAEGRWRFIESLSTYTRLFIDRMDRPDLESIRNIRPTIAIEQKNPVRTSRSTVGTATEINDYLRLLYSRIGKCTCPSCDDLLEDLEPSEIGERIIESYSGKKILVTFPLPYDTGDEIGCEAAISTLLKKGYFRVKSRGGNGEGDVGGGITYNLTESRPEAPPGGVVDVIADRLVVKETDRTRLVESIASATAESGGRARIEVLSSTGSELLDFTKGLHCSRCDITVERPSPLMLSFNHPVGACEECKGFGNILQYDEERYIPDPQLSISNGAIEPWTKPAYRPWYEEMAASAYKYDLDLTKPFSDLTEEERTIVFEGTEDFEGLNDFFDHLESKKYKLHIKVFISRYKGQTTCNSCKGNRLQSGALHTYIGGTNIADLSGMTIEECRAFFAGLELSDHENEISKELLKQITLKLDFLFQTGLGYITLNRLTKTLSGGEAQRVALATQLASALSGVLYILDEPSIGLHPKDISMLTLQIEKLVKRSNTVVVVEHERAIIDMADHIVELGPGAGTKGGRIVYSGSKEDFIEDSSSLTAKYLRNEEEILTPHWRRSGCGERVLLKGAEGNNLKRADIEIPLKTLTCVSGVSGSGKSTLVIDTLARAVERGLNKNTPTQLKPLKYESISGLEYLSGIRLIDQGPIGRTPRSNPITYIGGFDDIRQFYASLPQARSRDLKAGAFSFNVTGGRCEECKGEGVEKLEMYFLPDIYIKCGGCNGKRYKPQILQVKHRGKSIYDVLNMTFEDSLYFFKDNKNLERRFSIMNEVGLGYLKLGQSATTLSGGEAQRLKIARELVDSGTGGMLYILDEPTTGLHMDDTKKLLSVIGRLIDAGNTALVIEHNLDILKCADHIIEIGPEGGTGGGEVIFAGTPEELIECERSHTARYLEELLD